jgi:hypothetical protein
VNQTDRVEITATRRHVLKTGVKLAYATPLLAASMRLTEAGVGAVSDGGTGSVPCGATTCGTEESTGAQLACVDPAHALCCTAARTRTTPQGVAVGCCAEGTVFDASEVVSLFDGCCDIQTYAGGLGACCPLGSHVVGGICVPRDIVFP